MTQPPSYQTDIFNSSFFKSNTDALTLADADKRYLQLGGGTIGGFLNITGNCDVGSFSIGGATVSFDAISGVVAGTAANNKALVLGSSGEIATITSLTATNIYGSVKTAAQTSITSIGMLTNLTLNTGGTGLFTPNIKVWNSTTSLYDNFDHSAYIGFSYGGCVASKALVVDSNKDIGSIRNLSCTGTFTASTSISTPSLTTDTITKAGTQTMSATTLNLNPTTLQIRGTTLSATATEINAISGLTATATELNYNDLTTLGSFQTSKTMTLDASGRGIMPLGTDDTNCIRYSSGTSFRETINIYRTTDTSGLIIASKTNGVSTSKSYPILRLVSTSDPANLGTGSGVSATTNDLLRIDWNDKPTTGFTSQTHRLCFDIGNTRPYYSGTGYPHTFGIATSANALSLSVNASSAISGSDCLYIVSDTINKMLYNTNTPYTNANWGTANITLSQGNIYIKSSNDLNGNSSAYDMPLMMESSNATPIGFGVELHNGTSATTANAAFVGTLTSNDLAFMTGNNRRMTITSAGRVGIGTGTPVAPLQVSTTISYTWNSSGAVGTTVYRLRTDSGNTETATGTPITYTNVCAIFNGYIGCEAMVMQSDRRLKQDIADVPIERVECLYTSLKVQSYKWKNHKNKPKELGLIAQDVLNQGFLDLIARIPDNDKELEQSIDPWLEPKGIKLSVDYPKLSVYNMRMIQELIERVKDQQAQIDLLRAAISE